MKLKNKLKSVSGIVNVEIEGFFTERFINLCKINNIEIWEIKNIVNGVVRFNIRISDFKKLRKIAKKTKCKVKITHKKGIYFLAFKYRKRKALGLFILFILLSACVISNFIWSVDVVGNDSVSTDYILEQFKNNGLHIGTFKIGFDKSGVIAKVRAENSELSWIGIDINGTNAKIKVIEKTKLDENSILETRIGDIKAKKDAVITRIIPENGTATVKEGSYVEKGMTLIEGIIYSQISGDREVSAKGIVYGNTEYEYEREYKYINIKKEYTNKKRWTIGISINSKEYMINYLNKSLKYDKIKNSKNFNIFGNDISFDIYSFNEYIENEVILSSKDVELIANEDEVKFLNENILNLNKFATLVEKSALKKSEKDGIIYVTKYIINEQIGEFIPKYE